VPATACKPNLDLPKKASPTTRDRKLEGKLALITGASRGIGLAVAHALASEGCRLILSSRTKSSLSKAVTELSWKGAEVVAIPCDVRDPKSVDALVKQVRRRFDQVDILFNNAGVGQPNRSVDKLSPAIWKDVISTNLDGMFFVTRAVLPLIPAGGAIVNNLSIAAKRVFPGSAAYCAAKHGALGFTNTLREELRPRQIRVIALLPGATDTAIWKTIWPAAPRKKMLSSDTVAKAVLEAILLPSSAMMEELAVLPAAGTL